MSYEPFDPYHKSDYKNLRLHPYKIILALVLAGVTMLFVGMLGSYIYQRVVMGIQPIYLPNIFFANALVLAGSSYTLYLAKKAYLADDTEGYKRQLMFTLILTIAFMAIQMIGWAQMSSEGLMPSSGAGVGYIYAIAALHLIHVFAGLPFFVLFLIAAVKRMKDPVSVLIYFSDPEKRLKLRLLEVYWHYLDVLWVVLITFFIVNYWIS